MSSPLKKLAGHTAIYGLSSILGRFLNYLLTPLYTSKAVFQVEQYGIITEMYAYVAFLVVLLTYGMETAFFRYFSDTNDQKSKVFSTAMVSLSLSSLVFIALVSIFNQEIASLLGYPNHREYITWFGIIVGFDALIAIPLAKLRAENRSLQFAGINFVFIGLNIGLNLFFLAYCLPLYKSGQVNWLVETFYDPEIGVGYVFIANLIASIGRLLCVLPTFVRMKWQFDPALWKKLLRYALPLLVAGMAGIINETLDRAMLKWMLWDGLGEVETMRQLGIYGACYKLSIIITLFIQAYRYAAEPFFFDQKHSTNAPATYARMLHVFFGFVMLVFVGVSTFIEMFKHFIPNPAYWEGLDVVPILLLANVFLGVYYNQSVWYKLTDNTRMGSYISVAGAVITVALNAMLIPVLGFRGSALATLACYFSMSAISWYLGQKHYPIPYNLPRLALYFLVAIAMFALHHSLAPTQPLLYWTMRVLMVASFGALLIYLEFFKTHTHDSSHTIDSQ